MFVVTAPLRGTAQTNPTAPQATAKTPAATAPEPYHVIRTIPLTFNPPPGSALAFDPASRKLFIPAEKDIYVVDIDSGVLAGQVRKVGHVSDIAFAPEINRGFTVDSDGHLVIFDLQTYAVVAKVHAGEESFFVVVDSITKQVFTTGVSSKQCRVFDIMSGKLVKTVKLGGYPLGGVADSAGHIYFQLSQDPIEGPQSLTGHFRMWGAVSRRKAASKIVQLSTHTLEIENLWTEPLCINGRGIGVDSASRRLVAGCENSVELIDADTGKVISEAPFSGRAILHVLFNPILRDSFVLDGPLRDTVILHENSANSLAFAGIVAHEAPWYMAFDSPGGEFFILKSDEKTMRAPFTIEVHGQISPLQIPEPVPGTFRIVVYGRN